MWRGRPHHGLRRRPLRLYGALAKQRLRELDGEAGDRLAALAELAVEDDTATDAPSDTPLAPAADELPGGALVENRADDLPWANRSRLGKARRRGAWSPSCVSGCIATAARSVDKIPARARFQSRRGELCPGAVALRAWAIFTAPIASPIRSLEPPATISAPTPRRRPCICRIRGAPASRRRRGAGICRVTLVDSGGDAPRDSFDEPRPLFRERQRPDADHSAHRQPHRRRPRVQEFDAGMLRDPPVNVRFACLVSRAGSCASSTATSPSPSPATTPGRRDERWLEHGAPSPPTSSVEDIPFRETRHYVKRVLGNLAAYQAIYAGRSLELPEAIPASWEDNVSF